MKSRADSILEWPGSAMPDFGIRVTVPKAIGGAQGFMDANFSDKGELIPYLHNQRILWYHRAPELCRRRIFSQPASRVAVFASNRLTPC